MSVFHLCPFAPPRRLPVDSSHTCQQLPVFLCLRVFSGSGSLLGPFTEQTGSVGKSTSSGETLNEGKESTGKYPSVFTPVEKSRGVSYTVSQ